MKPQDTPRRSLGGHVVEDGLSRAGYDVRSGRGLALVETTQPRLEPFETVLAQNAWNVIPAGEFRRRLAEYPPRMRGRMLARRTTAQLNLRRAKRVISLTEAMGTLCARLSRRVEVSPVTVPIDFLDETGEQLPKVKPGTLLVPGTVTWYKNPQAGLDLFERHAAEAGWTQVLFAGGDDGSGCWQAVETVARSRGIAAERRRLSRDEMRGACMTADAVVVPSKMESLSFSIAEALLLSSRVFASRIDAHVEIATRLRRAPVWLDGEAEQAAPGASAGDVSAGDWSHEWDLLGTALGLSRAGSQNGTVR